MDATINPNSSEQSFGQTYSSQQDNTKSELMQFFEKQVNDIYWAHKDLLKAIFEAED